MKSQGSSSDSKEPPDKSCSYSAQAMTINFKPQNLSSPHNIYLNNERVSCLQAGVCEIVLEGLNISTLYQWYVTDAMNGKIISSGEFSLKSKEKVLHPVPTNLQLSTLNEDANIIVIRWIPGSSVHIPSCYSLKVIGKKCEQSIDLHDGNKYVSGDTCSAYINIEDLACCEQNPDSKIYVSAHYENKVTGQELVVDSKNGVKIPQWMLYKISHSVPASPKRHVDFDSSFKRMNVS